MLDNKTIENLFNHAAKAFGKTDKNAKSIFEKLIRETLAYNDHIAKANGEFLNVEDVTVALDNFQKIIDGKKISNEIPANSLNLIKRWIDSLNSNAAE